MKKVERAENRPAVPQSCNQNLQPAGALPVPPANAAWSRPRRVFHALPCRWASRIAESNREVGSSTSAASNGRRPCKVCGGPYGSGGGVRLEVASSAAVKPV